jgi:hypothetical protein
MAIKYINIFQSKALQDLPKFGFFVWKETIWQPCSAGCWNYLVIKPRYHFPRYHFPQLSTRQQMIIFDT